MKQAHQFSDAAVSEVLRPPADFGVLVREAVRESPAMLQTYPSLPDNGSLFGDACANFSEYFLGISWFYTANQLILNGILIIFYLIPHAPNDIVFNLTCYKL